MDVTETYLSHELTLAEKYAQYDEHVKRLLKDKGVLAYILIYAVEEFKDYSLDEAMDSIEGEPEVSKRSVRPMIQNQEPEAIRGEATESSIPGEGTMFFDIVFTVKIKDGFKERMYINLEAQKSFYPGYDLVTRGIVYATRLVSQQMDTDFTPQSYDEVKKVYSIWICMNTPEQNKDYKKVADTITEYSITPKVLYPDGADEKTWEGRYDLLSVVFVNLKDDMTEHSSNQLIGMLSTLLSSKKTTEEKRTVLEQKYGFAMTKQVESEAAAMCNLSRTIAMEKDVIIEEKDAALAEKDTALAEKDTALAEKDTALAEKDAEIEKMKKRIAELEAGK